VAPVNGLLFAGVRSEPGPGRTRRIAGRYAAGRGVWGAGVNPRGRRSRGVSPTRFFPTGPQIFLSLPEPRTSAARSGFHLPMEMK
jgi:hypothetical protein